MIFENWQQQHLKNNTFKNDITYWVLNVSQVYILCHLILKTSIMEHSVSSFYQKCDYFSERYILRHGNGHLVHVYFALKSTNCDSLSLRRKMVCRWKHTQFCIGWGENMNVFFFYYFVWFVCGENGSRSSTFEKLIVVQLNFAVFPFSHGCLEAMILGFISI